MKVIDKAKYAHDSLIIIRELLLDMSRSLRQHTTTKPAAAKLSKVCKDTRAVIQTLKERTC